MVRGRSSWRGVALAAALLGLPACGDPAGAVPGGGGDARAGSGGSLGSELLIFVFDRSTSVHDHEIEHALALTRERLGQLDHGDRIVAMELLELSLAEEPRRWSQQAPERTSANRLLRSDSVALARFIQDARAYVANFARTEDRAGIVGTDILSTLHLVAAEVQAHPDRRATLVLYSDMLQANAVMNMEGVARMPPPGWIEEQAVLGTLPDLSGLEVVVVGARSDSRAAQVVKEFWTEYFRRTGATLSRDGYRYRPVRLAPMVATDR